MSLRASRLFAHLSGARVRHIWLAGYAALLCLLLAQASERPPYDDSYFFKRFALNFLDHGVRKVSFDAACRVDRPEGLFLPHRVYSALNEEIQRSECIKGYVRVIEESSSPLYVRADLYPRYAACDSASVRR